MHELDFISFIMFLLISMIYMLEKLNFQFSEKVIKFQLKLNTIGAILSQTNFSKLCGPISMQIQLINLRIEIQRRGIVI